MKGLVQEEILYWIQSDSQYLDNRLEGVYEELKRFDQCCRGTGEKIESFSTMSTEFLRGHECIFEAILADLIALGFSGCTDGGLLSWCHSKKNI
ncbi:MAG: hypothetical protein M1341_01365 [Candidatus Thermoplasmatota archaeon]|jgi:hypothetical protein|nr:hypothetical protein [Candidatus Thermoplasmatota archaeon]